MKKTYPARFCPPEIFEFNKSSKILLENLDPLETESEVMNFLGTISKLIGYPDEKDWPDRYRDLWTPVLTRMAVEHGTEKSASLYDKVYVPVAREMLSSLGKNIARPLAKIDTPWIGLFCNWHAWGRKEYVISSGLSQKLRQTKLKGYPCESLRFPFRSIFIDLQNYEGFRDVKLEGCLVLDLNKFFGIVLVTTGEKEANFPRMLDISLKHQTLDEALKDAIERYKGNKDLFSNIDGFLNPWKELFSYIVNVILYATMPDAEQKFEYYDPQYERLKRRLNKLPKNSKKKKKIKEQLKKTSNRGVTLLGGSIPVDRTQERGYIENQKTGRTLTVRTLVSGHWRDQPYGKDNALRKRIWIEPFWRGPEGAPITRRQHNLKG